MSGRRDWAVLLLGLILGVSAASLYWHGGQSHRQFIFDHNLKCQQIARRFESDSSYRVGVLKVIYSPGRNSCVAEITRPYSGGIDYTVEDLISGETIFYRRTAAPDILDKQTLTDQDAKFAAAAR